MTQTVEIAVQVQAQLGEGPMWDEREQVLYWVDIMGHKLHRYDPATQTDETRNVGQPVGTVVLRENGGLMLAVRDGFASFDWESGKLEIVANPADRSENTRFNEGKCDPAGRFWAGDMRFTGTPCDGKLFALEPDLTTRVMVENLCITNGIVWTQDNQTMYHIDTIPREVRAYDYDLETGAISNERVAIHVPEHMGGADGMALDAEGMLWIAHFNGSCVRRWHPSTGEVLDQIDLPASQVTACAFAGENLDTLYITTARENFSEEQAAAEPLAGSVFVADPGVRGVPTHRFAG